MPNQYRSFKLALYCTAGTFRGLSREDIERDFEFIERHLDLSKVYLESHRGETSVGPEELGELKRFFESRGLRTAGGITPTLPPEYRPGFPRLFGAICYTDPASREKLRAEVKVAASVFDEIILDDFFFTNCTCAECIRSRGERSWEEFRLELMTEASWELVVEPAKAVNPAVKVVIKYPNWIESFAGTGYDTALQPSIFDGIYAGTETRDPTITQQNIPRYASYSILEWLEAIEPGKNGGGWFDAFDCSSIDNYLEQANLTVLGKAREITLFNYRLHRDSVYVPALGFQLEKLDRLARELGRPRGVAVYHPHHARGEDHLADYLGMIGIPVAPTPHFPETPLDTALVLTASATRDPDVLGKLDAFLQAGGRAVVTSGFVERLRGKGIERLTTLRPTGRWLDIRRYALDTTICTFDEFLSASDGIVFPVLEHDTNATWQGIVGFSGETNLPILTWDRYGPGELFMLAVPHDPADLARLPSGVLSKLRHVLSLGIPAHLEGPGEVGFFTYDNDTVVVESFAREPTKWRIRVGAGYSLVALLPGDDAPVLETDSPAGSSYRIRLVPRALQGFRLVRDQRSATGQ
jgi:hypothetical protein